MSVIITGFHRILYILIGQILVFTRTVRVDQTFDTLHGGIQRILHFLRLTFVTICLLSLSKVLAGKMGDNYRIYKE